jgi:hypothetical protein
VTKGQLALDCGPSATKLCTVNATYCTILLKKM